MQKYKLQHHHFEGLNFQMISTIIKTFLGGNPLFIFFHMLFLLMCLVCVQVNRKGEVKKKIEIVHKAECMQSSQSDLNMHSFQIPWNDETSHICIERSLSLVSVPFYRTRFRVQMSSQSKLEWSKVGAEKWAVALD